MSLSIKSRLQQKLKIKEEEKQTKKQDDIANMEKIIFNCDDSLTGIKVGDFIILNFNVNTGKLIYITDGDVKIHPPKELEWLNVKHIVFKSITEYGGIFAVKPKELEFDDYPDAMSFILMEKINLTDRLKINICITLKYNDTYVKSKELLSCVFANINSFWVIFNTNSKSNKENNDSNLMYFYKPKYDKPEHNQENKEERKISDDYLYTDIIIKHNYICSLWSTHNISPPVLYIVVYDENYDVIVLQYTIFNHNSLFPKIFHYDTDISLCGRGKYLTYCVNFNICMFTVILELPDNEKCFYTGIISISNPDQFKHSEIALEFTDMNHLQKNLSLYQCQQIILKIMRDTEINIIKMTLLENKKHVEKHKMINAIKDRELKEKSADDNLKLLLEEEEKKQKIKAQKEKEKQKKKENNKRKRIEEIKLMEEQVAEIKRIVDDLEAKQNADELETTRISDVNNFIINDIINYLLDNVMDKVTTYEVIDKVTDEVTTDEVMDKVTEPIKPLVPFKQLELPIMLVEYIKPIDPTESIKSYLPMPIKSNKQSSKRDKSNKQLNKQKVNEPIKPTALLPIMPIMPIIPMELVPITPLVDLSILNVFINNIYLINHTVADSLKNAPTMEAYLNILFINRFIIMHEIDNIVVNHPYILKIKEILDKNNVHNNVDTNNNINAIYGSYLAIIYSLILKSIGFQYNPFSKYENPLDEVDIDTMSISFLSDDDMQYGYDFICAKPTIISYHTDVQPVQNTKVKISSIDTLLNNCWDINSTSAILFFEKDSPPHIMRNPDFTDFLFGVQPIKLIFGKNQYNLYNSESTEKRLLKAQKKWY